MGKMHNTPPAAKPKPNIYTALTIVAVLALATSLVFGYMALTSPSPDGYELKFEEIFQPSKVPTSDAGAAPQDKGAAPAKPAH